MKKQIRKKATSAGFFESPEIKKIMNDPKRRASIEAKTQYLYFLEKIERIRKTEGITQVRLSKLTHIGQDELSRIENGKKNITLETFFKIINGLGYKVEYHKEHGMHV